MFHYPRNVGTDAEEPPVPLVTPDNDAGKDGRSDLDEAIEGTDANDAQSSFQPVPATGASSFPFSFQGLEDSRYVLLACPTMEIGRWHPIEQFVPTSSGQPVVLNDADGPGTYKRRFYRVLTEFPW